MPGKDPTRRHDGATPKDWRIVAAGEGDRWQLAECPRCYAIVEYGGRRTHWVARGDTERIEDEMLADWQAWRDAYIPGGE